MHDKQEVERIKKMWPKTGIHPNYLDEDGNLKPQKPRPSLREDIKRAFSGLDWHLIFILSSISALIGWALLNIHYI